MKLFRSNISLKFFSLFSILVLGNIIFSSPQKFCGEEECCHTVVKEIKSSHNCCSLETESATEVTSEYSIKKHCSCMDDIQRVTESISIVKPNSENNSTLFTSSLLFQENIESKCSKPLVSFSFKNFYKSNYIFILNSSFLI